MMRQNGPLKRTSYVRNLSFTAVRKLCLELDADSFWERMIQFIPKNLTPGSEFTPRYTTQEVSMFAREINRSNGSPTRAILNDWSTQNCTIQQLLDVLEQAELIEAANFIKEEVLFETVDDESDDEEEAVGRLPVPSILLPPPAASGRDVPENQPLRVMNPVRPEPQSDFSLSKLNTIPQPVQNNLSMTPPPSLHPLEAPSFDQLTLGHQDIYSSLGEKAMLAECAPNLLTSHVRMEKVQGKAVEKQIDRELLEPAVSAPPPNHNTPPPPRCAGAAVRTGVQNTGRLRPVVQNTGEIQHLPYEALYEVTQGFNEVNYSEGGRLIGSGGFGMVHLGIDHDGKRLAVKVLKSDSEPGRKQFQVEIKTLSQHHHPSLITLLGFSCDGPKSCIVFEYMSNGSLEDRLACLNGTAPLASDLRVEICKGSARGIVYLNDNKFIHRDVKSANILLDESYVPKLGDFATARLGPSGKGESRAQTSMVIGTSAYLAPEAQWFDVSAKLDSFSFGVVILELLTALPAFDVAREDKALGSHILENYDDIMPLVDPRAGEWNVSTARKLHHIAVRCLEHSKKKRVLVSEVLPEMERL